MPTNVLIRRIAAKDLSSVAAIHMEAFPDSALTMLGTEAVRRYYEWQLTGPHDVTALGAAIGSEIVGFCFGGIFRGATSGFLYKNRMFLLWRVLTHPWLASNPIFRQRLTRGARLLKRFKKPVSTGSQSKDQIERSFGILAIATCPLRQSSGVGKLLMKQSEQIARQHGFQEMSLTVHPHNHQAISFYERLDWKKLSTNGPWNGQMRKSLAFFAR